ncbi:MAG: response regulator transcription factor [Kofleriaceae bacterium]
MRALIIEDYAPIREAVGSGLEEHGFAVDLAKDGAEGWWLAESNPYDVVVLDIMLPRLDGLTLLKRLRAKGDKVAVLLLTAKDTVEDRVRGLDLGADDYLVKPFAFAELVARVRALVRRRYDVRDPTIHIDDLAIDTVARTVRRADKDISLSPREYALLEYLAVRAGELVTRTQIWEHVYDFNSEATSNVVDVYVGYLRKKLGAPVLIHTRRGFGYVLGGNA